MKFLSARQTLIFLIRQYQNYLSFFLGGQCRFWPSCSNYAIKAVEKNGAFKGAGLFLKRIAKCHPFHPGGIDVVQP